MLRPVRVDRVALLETFYRVEQAPSAWLEGVLEMATACLRRPGSEVCAYYVDLSGGGFSSSAMLATRPSVIDFWREWSANVPLEVRRAIHTYAPCGENSTLPPMTDASEWMRPHTDAMQVLGVNGLDASLRGCAIARFQMRSDAPPIDAAEMATWGHVAAHLAPGARLVHMLASGRPLLDEPEAVLAPGGKIVHADGAAKSATARAALRDAARSADRARTKRGRADERDAIEAWGALVAGRWSLVDAFDRDGRRYVVARPNEPDPAVELESALSRRELQVARAAALGHADKLIAYELGLAPSTVARLLARARAKLGARNRVELVARLRAGQ